MYLTFIKDIYAVSCSFLWGAFIKLRECLLHIVSNKMLEIAGGNKLLYCLCSPLVKKIVIPSFFFLISIPSTIVLISFGTDHGSAIATYYYTPKPSFG